MSSDAARLEAIGEPNAPLSWRGHDLSIPRAVEDWPLDDIRNGRHVDAVAALLDGQTAPVPLYGDLLSLSDAMSAAVGVQRLPEAKPLPVCAQLFGAVPFLLQVLDAYETDIISDLRRFWGVDYLDRWRGTLTLRGIWTYIRRLPADSALGKACNDGHELWTKPTVVLAQIWEQLAGQVYVGRPMTAEELDRARAKERENAKKMTELAAKQDYYSAAASRARANAATRGAATPRAAGGGRGNDLPSAAMTAMDKAMAARRREITHDRKAG